jgi:molybdenum cofactor guanylyltransferase
MISSDHDHHRTDNRHLSAATALVGASCSRLCEIAERLSMELAAFSVLYVDEEHDSVQEMSACSHWTRREQGFQWTCSFGAGNVPTGFDVVMVNGQHFSADRYIVVAYPEKEHSVRKRAKAIRSILAVILPEGVADVPDYIRSLSVFNENVPVFAESDLEACAHLMRPAIPGLRALVLTGGKSVRMGTDKSMLDWHGLPQWQWLTGQLESVGIPAFVSVRQAQDLAYDRVVTDRFLDMGPIGGIFSAFLSAPQLAWLVVACDMPLVQSTHLQELVAKRNASCHATAFYNGEKQWLEPLLTIYEPKAFSQGLGRLAEGKTCPRKWLNGLPSVLALHSNDLRFLKNVNTMEEREALLEQYKNDLH